MVGEPQSQLLDVLVRAVQQSGLQSSNVQERQPWEFCFAVNAVDRDRRWLKQQADLFDATLASVSLPVLPSITNVFSKDDAQVCISYSHPEILKFFKENGKLDEYCRQLWAAFEGGLIARRPKRKKHQLPFPNLPVSHPDNLYEKLTKTFKTDISPDLADRFNAYWKKSGKKKRELVEDALAKFLDENDPQ